MSWLVPSIIDRSRHRRSETQSLCYVLFETTIDDRRSGETNMELINEFSWTIIVTVVPSKTYF